MRFLGGCFVWMTCLAWTLFPILMSINYLYAKSSFDSDAIDRASLTALVQGTRGLHLLPIHVVAVWIVLLSWIANLAWLGHGALRVRHNELRRLIRDDAERHQLSTTGVAAETRASYPPAPTLDLDPSIPDSEIGWRYRTCLVRNIPPLLRSEQSLREYFERYLRDEPPTAPAAAAGPTSTSTDSPPAPVEKHEYPPVKRSGDSTPSSSGPAAIVEIVLVRRHTELNQLYFARYREVLHQLETAHVELARAVMQWVRERVERDEALRAGKKPKGRKRAWWKKHVRRQDVEHEAREGDDVLLARLSPFLDSSRTALPPSTTGDDAETLWEALHDLQAEHPSILDRFQPLFRLRYFSAAVPAIDYFLLKHNLLYSLIEDKRAHPESVDASSSAFVTFERAADARRARTALKWRPIRDLYRGRVLDCKITVAPELRDLHWPRLALVSLSSDLLRGTLLQALIWAITIVWVRLSLLSSLKAREEECVLTLDDADAQVLPISVLIGLLSLNSLRDHVPARASPPSLPVLSAELTARSLQSPTSSSPTRSPSLSSPRCSRPPSSRSSTCTRRRSSASSSVTVAPSSPSRNGPASRSRRTGASPSASRPLEPLFLPSRLPPLTSSRALSDSHLVTRSQEVRRHKSLDRLHDRDDRLHRLAQRLLVAHLRTRRRRWRLSTSSHVLRVVPAFTSRRPDRRRAGALGHLLDQPRVHPQVRRPAQARAREYPEVLRRPDLVRPIALYDGSGAPS